MVLTKSRTGDLNASQLALLLWGLLSMMLAYLSVHIAGVRPTSAAAGISAFLLSLVSSIAPHERHILRKLIVMMLIQHALLILLVDDLACVDAAWRRTKL